jgi:peptide/nickel transport system permease protein
MATNVAKLSAEEQSQESQFGQTLLQLALRRLRRDRLTLIAMGVIVFLALISIFAPVITAQLGVNFDKTNMRETFLPVNSGPHILGTDDLGRDHLARLLYGGQVSLGIAFSAAILSLTIGLVIGVYTGYRGGIVDDIVNWIITTLDSVPSLFLLLIVAAVFRPGPGALVIILGLLGWTGTARLVRGETFALREREYVIGARSIGAAPLRIMFYHIVPNLLSIVVISMAVSIGSLMLTEAALSYLGLGVKDPFSSWGSMLEKSKDFLRRSPHLIVAPGLLIWITVLCLYIIGDGMRDAFDPTTRD